MKFHRFLRGIGDRRAIRESLPCPERDHKDKVSVQELENPGV